MLENVNVAHYRNKMPVRHTSYVLKCLKLKCQREKWECFIVTIILKYIRTKLCKFKNTTIRLYLMRGVFKACGRTIRNKLGCELASGTTYRYQVAFMCPWEGLRQRSIKVLAGPHPKRWVGELEIGQA